MRNLEPDKARLHQISGKSYITLNSPLTSIGSPSLLGQALEFRTSLRIDVYDALLSARETEFEEIGERAVLRSIAVHPTGLLERDYFRVARDPPGEALG